MSDYGLTDAGFVRKRLDEIVASLETALRAIYGDNLSLGPDSPSGQLLGVFAGAVDEVWEVVGEVTTQFDPQGSRGALLSKLVQLNGIVRQAETYTLVDATLGGTPSATIPAGSIATTTAGDAFELVANATIGGGGTVTGQFRASETGPIPCAAGTLTIITTPVSGWSSVTNPADGDLGSLEETDPELRRRREVSTELGATNIYEALLGALRDLDGVDDAIVIVNETLVTDGFGLPGKSFRAVVDGGADQAIADTIWDKHPMGISTSGTETETVIDSEGVSQTVYFSRPADVEIYVTMTIVTDSAFPSDGDEQIKQAIVDFAAGQLVGYEEQGFGIGHDVEYSRLFTPINTVPGHTVSSLFIGTAPSPSGTANIAITPLQISRFDTSRIVVT